MQFFSNRSNKAPETVPSSSEGLGTFGGVYTPSILTILGVIMYLRFGWVLGNVGLLGTLLIVTLSTAITLLTALSISAIATDRVVRVGGAYYMISRSLGIETGGAVGIPLYFAQALSVALYTIGFAESVIGAFSQLNQTYVALITTVIVAAIALISAKFAIQAQYFIMAAIVFSLISLLLGKPLEPTQIELWGTSGGEPFWQVFAVFFPAVTGIMAGVNMSGDLRNPIRAIPVGTLAAVGTGYLVYMGLPLVLATRVDAATLIAEPLIMRQISFWGPAIFLGVWGSTLSSALGSILGAPRILQALARDGVLPRWMSFLGKGSGADDEPRIGTAVTLVVVIAAVYIGDLDLIAPVLTMFFLTTYLVLNVSAGVEGFLNSPSFRPLFRVHWSLSLLGAIGCLAAMLLINPIATLIASLTVIGFYLWLQRRELSATWGDVRQGIWMMLLRTSLFQLGHRSQTDTKNWRPHFLVLSGALPRRWGLVELANALNHNRGLFTVASILPPDSRDLPQQENLEETIRNSMQERGIQALVRLLTAPDPFEGARRLVEIYGLGPMVPDTVLLGNNEDLSSRDRYCWLIDQLHQAQRNVLIFRDAPEIRLNRNRQIDVWWGGLEGNGGLMLLLADLLRANIDWREATLNLKLIVEDTAAAADAEANLANLMQKLRIAAMPEVLVSEEQSFEETLKASSQTADMVFLGMAAPEQNFGSYYAKLQSRTQNLPPTVFVLAAPDFSFAEVLMA
ncbi:MAG: amino acid permease [Leptolyngbyaceae cyanobacterium RM1_1_2]|nr:amino acid permease [Leptolyngbyaceae cyanobacterium RM1_1_2]